MCMWMSCVDVCMCVYVFMRLILILLHVCMYVNTGIPNTISLSQTICKAISCFVLVCCYINQYTTHSLNLLQMDWLSSNALIALTKKPVWLQPCGHTYPTLRFLSKGYSKLLLRRQQ